MSNEIRKRFNRFPPKASIDWLDREQRKEHRHTIKTLTDLSLALEEGHDITPQQDAFIRSITGSDARDTRINAMWDILQKTETSYMSKLAAMAPYDLTAYHELINPHEPPAHHHYFLCDHLMKVESGEINTLIVALPPGAAKSTFSSRTFAQWVLGRNPDWRVLACGHSQKFVENEFSKPNRSVLESDAFHAAFPDVYLNPKEKGSDFWRLDGWRGSYACRGALAGTSGLRARIVLGDDLYKNAADALSPVVRDNIWRWWTADVMSRRLPGAPVVLVNCLTGETPVLRADGSWTEIAKLRVGDELMTYDKDSHAPSIQRVERWAEQPEDLIYEINTGNGKVRCNGHHPFWTRVYRYKGKWEEPKWVNAEDLKPYDKVLHGAAYEGVAEAKLSEDEAWVLGLFYGDGCVSRSFGRAPWKNEQLFTRLSTSHDPTNNIKIAKKLRAVFGVDFHLKNVANNGGHSSTFQTSVLSVGRWLIENGVHPGATAHTKRVPSWMFSQPRAIRRAFVDGFVEADGHVNENYSAITLCNEALVRDLRVLLMSLGEKPNTLARYEQRSTLPGKTEKFYSTRYRVMWRPHLAHEDAFYWKGVTSVINTGKREKVYDIQVSSTHNFIADNIVVSNTLWHSEDVPNRLKKLAEESPEAVPQPFVFINIPAEAKEDDPLGRAPGEWLWCKDTQEDGFYSTIDYTTKRDTLPPSLWSALYLGETLDKFGDFIKEDDFQRYQRPPINKQGMPLEWVKTVMSVDCAAKGKERSDYTAILIFRKGVDGFHYLVDVWRGKEKMETIVRRISRMMRVWQVNHAIIEDSGMGTQILENYAGMLPSPIGPATPSGKGSKEFRFDAAAPWITSGKILFPEKAPWLADFINELVAFPNGQHDDQVDAFSQYTDMELKTRVGGTKPLKARAS